MVQARETEAGQDEEAVMLPRPLSFVRDRREILVEPVGRYAQMRPRIVMRVDVIGDAKNVESILSVDVNEWGGRQSRVAPGRMTGSSARSRSERSPTHLIYPQRDVRPRIYTVNIH
jgi:hypothetical protein